MSVVVVGACIAMGTWLATSGGRTEPATTSPGNGRGDDDPRRIPALVRLRSGVALGCLSVVLGALAAAGVGLVLVLLFFLLRESVG